MKSASEFFVDYLIEDPRSKQRWLISGPSNSPEIGGLVMGPTMDHQIIRNLMANTIAAAKVLDVDQSFATDAVRSTCSRIAPNQIGQHGQLQEWLEDKDDPNNKHRHVSHLWGLHPGNEITPATSDLLQAAKQSLTLSRRRWHRLVACVEDQLLGETAGRRSCLPDAAKLDDPDRLERELVTAVAASIRICLTRIHHFKSTATLERRAASPRCCCSHTSPPVTVR